MQDGDAVALFNFRSDRMVEISKAFEYEDFNAFDRKRFPKVSLLPSLIFSLPCSMFFPCAASDLAIGAQYSVSTEQVLESVYGCADKVCGNDAI